MARKIRLVEEDDVDPREIGHFELVRMVLGMRGDYVTKAEFSTFTKMLLAGATIAGGGLVTLLVMAINIRNGG